jgi:vacuolar-type H+-ATPase subunit I/STV1
MMKAKLAALSIAALLSASMLGGCATDQEARAALSIAVLTLAEMMGATGHVITVILGNVFVLVLEGGIVMIQVMRLQYYEGFSRYFSGEGHEFSPLRLRSGTEARQP